MIYLCDDLYLLSTVKVSFKSHILQRAFQYLRNIDGIFCFLEYKVCIC